MASMKGYNILVKINGNAFVGETSSSMDVSANVKESYTKEGKGVADREVTGHSVSGSISGLMRLKKEDETNVMDSDAILEAAMQEGKDALFPFVYTRDTGKAYKGNLIINSYSESGTAEGEATYTLNYTVSGKMVPADEV